VEEGFELECPVDVQNIVVVVHKKVPRVREFRSDDIPIQGFFRVRVSNPSVGIGVEIVFPGSNRCAGAGATARSERRQIELQVPQNKLAVLGTPIGTPVGEPGSLVAGVPARIVVVEIVEVVVRFEGALVDPGVGRRLAVHQR